MLSVIRHKVKVVKSGGGVFSAQIIASEAAVKDQKARVNVQFFMLGTLVGEKEVKATDPSIKHKISFSIDCTNSDI